MYTQAEMPKENKSQSAANGGSHMQSSGESTFQFVDNRPEVIAQRKLQEMANSSSLVKQAAQFQAMANNRSAQQQQPIQKKENNTGLPDNLKTGIENLSGYSMDNVKVHYNSDNPAQLQAHAYAQGTDIHLASGQEKHLPHEAWHVVQQKQGRVKPTMLMRGKVNVNDDMGLEEEADVMGAKALQLEARPEEEEHIKSSSKNDVFQKKALKQSTPSSGVAQAIMSLVEFQTATPGHWYRPRNTVTQVDAALATYIGNKTHANAVNLVNVANAYANSNSNAGRRAVAAQLEIRAILERNLLNEIGDANSHLVDALFDQVGTAHAVALNALGHELGNAHSALMPHLIALSGGAANLGQLTTIVQHITAGNAYLLSNLIPLTGGAANLGDLDNLIQHIGAANAVLLMQLIPIAGGAAARIVLDNLIVATGLAHLGLLPQMIPNAGGAGAVPFLTTAINLNHPGQGNLAQNLTTVAGGNLVRFQQLVNILPNFTQTAPPGAVPGNVIAEVNNYNVRNAAIPLVNGGIAPVGNNLPFNQRIGQVNFDHFLERHTMRYFNFGGIIAANDLWPYVGAGTDANVGNVLAAVLQTVYANPGNWWIQPNIAQPVVAGGFQSTVGTIGGGPNMPNPITGLGNIPSLILGQFFPMPAGGGGVIPMDNNAMNAIHQLL